MADKTILIVDDETPIRDMLRVALEMAEYSCLEAADAQKAHSMQPRMKMMRFLMSGAPLAANQRLHKVGHNTR